MFKGRDLILFELWKTCGNNCTFCVDKYMKESSESVKENFKVFCKRALKISNSSAVGILGGELFDGTIHKLQIETEFKKFLDILSRKIKSGNIKTLCITTNLIYESLDELIYYLKYLINNGVQESQILITTSYDSKGRFNRPNSENWWKFNVNKIRQIFPKIIYHCEIILTDNFCKEVIEGNFDLGAFITWWGGSINFNQPYAGFKFISKEDFENTSPGFFLRRDNFLKFCKIVKNNNFFDLSKIFLGTNAGDETLMTEEDYGSVVVKYREFENDAMGRNKSHFGYLDSDKDIFEDIKRVVNAIE